MSKNPVLDAAISALKSAANKRGAESIMTTDPDGNVLIMLGADDPDKHSRLQACIIELAMKEPRL
jgi:hypothetical protein